MNLHKRWLVKSVADHGHRPTTFMQRVNGAFRFNIVDLPVPLERREHGDELARPQRHASMLSSIASPRTLSLSACSAANAER